MLKTMAHRFHIFFCLIKFRNRIYICCGIAIEICQWNIFRSVRKHKIQQTTNNCNFISHAHSLNEIYDFIDGTEYVCVECRNKYVRLNVTTTMQSVDEHEKHESHKPNPTVH